MAGLFKDRFNYESLYKLALEIQTVYAGFQVEAFLHSTMDNIWDSLEFKQRVTRISTNLGKYLPADYKTALHIINKVILNNDVCLDGFVIFFPGFVELYGQNQENWDVSMAALARYTPYASAEFAVRSFIIQDEERMMAQMAAGMCLTFLGSHRPAVWRWKVFPWGGGYLHRSGYDRFL